MSASKKKIAVQSNKGGTNMFLLRPTAEQLCVCTRVWGCVCACVCEGWRAWKTGRKRNDILTLPHMLLHGDLWMHGVMDS